MSDATDFTLAWASIADRQPVIFTDDEDTTWGAVVTSTLRARPEYAKPKHPLFSFRYVLVSRPLHDALTISWALNPAPLPDGLSFVVERSQAQGGPWEYAGTAMDGAFEYTDTEVFAVGSIRQFWFRVVALADVRSAGGVLYGTKTCVAISPAAALLHDADVLALEMIRKRQLFLRRKAGIPGSILRKKAYGATCGRCFDRMRRLSTDPDCPDCYGVGFLGGYLPPVPVFFARSVYGKAVEDNMASGTLAAEFGNTPILAPKDILVDGVVGTRFAIDKIDPRTRKGCLVAQLCTMVQLDDANIVYTIPALAPEADE